jgi:uncharacterized protein YifE (UPF0438 family)
MKAPKTHKKYLNMRDFEIRCADIFDSQEREIIHRYGHWLAALTSGEIEPVTPEQERFVRVMKGELKPETVFELVWKKFSDQLISEANSHSPSPVYRAYDPGEAWFPRSQCGKSWYDVDRYK